MTPSTETTKGRSLCLMIGRCYVVEIAHLLLRSDEFRRDYQIRAFSSVDTAEFATDFLQIMNDLPESSLVVYQPVIWDTWGDDGLYHRLMDAIPSELTQITFPYPVFHPLWPFYYNYNYNDNDNDVNRAAAAGHVVDDKILLSTYGDANVFRMVGEGIAPMVSDRIAPTEIVRRCLAMDIPAMIDLDRLKTKIIEIQRIKELETDVKVLDFVQENYKLECVFSCINHGSNLLLFNMANQILQKLEYKPLPNNLLDRLGLLCEPEIPIHPSVVRYFNLRWVAPNHRYQLDRRHILTYEEYIYELATAWID